MRLAVLFLLCAALACSRATVEPAADTPPTIAPSSDPPTATQDGKILESFPGRGVLRIADRPNSSTIELELARKDAERQQGLMFRQKMADDHGMLFFMPYDNDWVFYMRNTYIPLDMVFIDRAWRVVGIVENVPPLTEDHRSVAQESRYVLELTAHTAGKLGLHAGTRVIFEPRPDVAAPAP